MTKTSAEAHAVVDAARRHNVVMTVGVQSMADPTWRMANEMVRRGEICPEYDQRDVPDVASVVADYDEGCQLIITATMINDYGIDEVIRGRLATLKFGTKTRQENGQTIREFGYEVIPQNITGTPS